MSTAQTNSFTDVVANLPLSAGSTVRADTSLTGLDQLSGITDAEREIFWSLAALLAHQEGRGKTFLGFSDDDAVEFNQDDATPEGLADDPQGDQAEEPDSLNNATFTDHRVHWAALQAIHQKACSENSPFFVDYASDIPRNAEFVIDLNRSRLFFARAADNEKRLWADIDRRAGEPSRELSDLQLKQIDALFPYMEPDTPESQSRSEQIAAVHTVLTRLLSVLTGPPGTGKTFTIVRIALTWLCQEISREGIEDHYRRKPLLLLAPTGRAAARMGELIDEALTGLESDAEVMAALEPHGLEAINALRNTKPQTIHRALEWTPFPYPSFRRNRGHRLEAGLVIVDETSMLGLELARQLFDATDDDANICLVGDPNQLEAVEMGSVLYDLVVAGHHRDDLQACHALLTISRRFPPGSMIDRLAKAIRAADGGEPSPETLEDLLQANRTSLSEIEASFDENGSTPVAQEATVKWLEVPASELARVARRIAERQAGALAKQADLPDIAATLRRSIVLSTTRRGPTGAHTLAEHALKQLRGRASINPYDLPVGATIMITRNNRSLALSNGDLAIVRETADGTPAKKIAVFPDGREFDVRVLPDFQPAAALTVHKAQGSEWLNAVIFTHALSRPSDWRLLYTACTRSSETATLITANKITGPRQTPRRKGNAKKERL